MKHAIHCETEEEARAVLQIAHDAGLKWGSGANLIETIGWDKFDNCLNLNVEGLPGRVLRSPKDWYEKEGYTIVKAQDFIEADRKQKEENETH